MNDNTYNLAVEEFPDIYLLNSSVVQPLVILHKFQDSSVPIQNKFSGY